jgi:hypothetical protein
MPLHKQIIIVGKTFAGAALCIGGIDREGKGYRLKRPDFPFWDRHSGFEIGQEYEIVCEPFQNLENPHHVEDVIVHHKRNTGKNYSKSHIVELLKKLGIIVASADPRVAFISTREPHVMKQHTVRDYCYLDKEDVACIKNSVAFWRCPFDLPARESEYGVNFFNKEHKINIKYVGAEKFVELLPAGLVIRLSTSGLWSPSEDRPLISYLQLSGWFV